MMDKRTFLFVILVGVTFFGLNLFFSHQRDAKNREIMQRNEATRAAAYEQNKEVIEAKTAQVEDLPIVDLVVDGRSVAQGINVKGSTLTLAWTRPLPEMIEVDGVQQTLMTKESVQGGPVLYAREGTTSLDFATVGGQAIDVQLVTFPPEVHLGEFRNGTLTVFEGRLDSNAIGLYKTPAGWLPLGFYESKGNIFVELDRLPILKNFTQKAPEVVVAPSEQKYYVLENDYQQLVFTNVGGALSAINLPFESEENPHSVVKEIEFGRQIDEESPENAHFPAHAHFVPGKSEEQPKGEIGGYYPLIRRGLVGKQIPAQYLALNIVSEYPEMAELVYTVKEFTPNKIVFEATQPHRKITKTYIVAEKADGAPYTFDLNIKIDGDSRGLWLSSGIPEVEIMSNSSSPIVQYRQTRRGKSEVEKIKLPKPGQSATSSSLQPDWIVDSNGYLGVIMDPLSEIEGGYRILSIPGNIVPTRLSLIDPKYTPYPASKYPGYQVLLPLPARGGETSFRVYSGPFEESVLKKVDRIFADPATGYTPDYIACRTFYGWFSFISEPFSKMLFVVMKFFHMITHSWGFSIILLTIFLRLLLYPLNAWSFKSMRRMQQLSPTIQAIQKKYKKEPKKAQLEIMALYREKKVNPFMGCLPILIQIPFLIGMFDLLKSSFQLRGASFIPGWIENLTAPDVLFSWQRPIFFFGTQFHLLPFLLGGVMFVQQRVSSSFSASKDPSKMTDQQRQQKAMGTVMTVVFTVMFYNFPSGLNLYWLSSMILGIGQQWFTNKVLDKKHPNVEIIAPTKR